MRHSLITISFVENTTVYSLHIVIRSTVNMKILVSVALRSWNVPTLLWSFKNQIRWIKGIPFLTVVVWSFVVGGSCKVNNVGLWLSHRFEPEGQFQKVKRRIAEINFTGLIKSKNVWIFPFLFQLPAIIIHSIFSLLISLNLSE